MKLPTRRTLALLGAVTVVAGLSVAFPGPAAADPATSFVPFSRFISDVNRMSYGMQLATGRVGAVRDAAAFADMRSYVLDMYQGVVVKQSFVNGENHYFDCVTTESQPSLHYLKDKTPASPPVPAAPPKPPAEPDGATEQARTDVAQARQETGFDKYGNAMSCPQGTIPMHRISIERLTNFATVKDFLAKGPDGAGRAPDTTKGTQALGQRHYGHGYQFTPNFGGQSILNLWDVDSFFNISQHWYVSPYGFTSLQSVEGGTIDYPRGFGNRAVLFVYYTPDNYLSGCYNLSCRGFVQVNNNGGLGNYFQRYSIAGGVQIELQMQWKFVNGNWWLYLYRGTVADAVGYYPGSAYGSGPLSVGSATSVDYGGEVLADPSGSGPYWSKMGSGFVPSTGFGWVAYQRNIFLILQNYASQWTYLNAVSTSSPVYNCYQVLYYDAPSGGSYTSHIYFGGAGSLYNLC